MRRAFGFALVVTGAVLTTAAGARYAMGAWSADLAHRRWNESVARNAVSAARSSAALDEHAPVANGAPVARLIIPRIDLDEIVVEGVGDNELNAGPGHVPGSAIPGQRGNAIISAHRDRHFSRFDALRVGDTLTTESASRATRWVIVSTRVIDKNAPALFRRSDTTLTLTTCWPIRYLGTAPERLIVTAKPAL